MDLQTCIKKLEYVGTLNFATVDKYNCPKIRCVSAIHYEADAIYFFTATGKNFYRELIDTKKVQVLGLTKYKEMIRLSGNAELVTEDEAEYWKDVIFTEQPYLLNVYPGETRSIGVVFVIRMGLVEYFNLGVSPIFREEYSFGGGVIEEKGYHILDQCMGCGKCKKNCPQNAVDEGKPYRIRRENCLHCGMCVKVCPMQAVATF